MIHPISPNRPPGQHPILQQIAEAHASPDDESLTEAAIIASVEYLQQLPPEIHWLCDSSPLIAVVVQAIQLWGYGEPPAQARLASFKPFLTAALNRCPECAVAWHMDFRKELTRVFTQVYSYDEASTAEFYIALDDWDAERVTAGLDNAIKIGERLAMAWKHNEVRGPLMECLAGPGLLLRDVVLKLWKDLFLRLEKLPAGVGEKWIPGALVLLFDSDGRVRAFGQQLLNKRDHKISTVEFDSDFRKTLVTLLERESQRINSRSFETSSIVWTALTLIIQSSEQSLIQSTLTTSPFDFVNLLVSHFSTPGPHFLSLLAALSQFLQSLSTGFWQRSHTSALNLVDLIFSSLSFENIILHPETLSSGQDLSVLLDWLPTLIGTLSDQAKVQVTSKILSFCLEKFNHPRFPEISRSFCLSQGMRLLRMTLENCIADTELVERDVDLALKLETAQMVDKYDSVVTRTLSNADGQVIRVLGLRLRLDCVLLEREMKELLKPDVYRGRVVPTLQLSSVWNVIERRLWTEEDTGLIRSVLAAINRAVVLDLLDSKKFESKDVGRVKQYNEAVYSLQNILAAMFTKLGDIRPRILRSILEDEETCISVTAHLLNAKRLNLESADLSMLKTAYDVSGKSDLWKQLLKLSFKPALLGICQVSQQILSLQKIYPFDKVRSWHRVYLLTFVSKIIRQGMQIVELLCSGRSGILTTTDIISQSDSNTSALQKFWRTFWETINVAFVSAMSWAKEEDKDAMKNFLRDVLEGASVHFDALKCLDASLSGRRLEDISPIKASTVQHNLLKDVQTPLRNLSKWLALSVEDLRETTLNLAIRMLRRFARAEVRVREDTIVQYYRLAHGKKNNNMSEDQRERLLLALSEHDVEPETRKAVEAMTPIRSSSPILLSSGRNTPDSTKSSGREIVDITDDNQYLGDYLTDSELSEFMNQFEKQKAIPKPVPMKQTKLDFTKGTLRPPVLTAVKRTASMPSKPATTIQKASGSGPIAQLKAEFNISRSKASMGLKLHRAPVAAPATDGFGRPLDTMHQVAEPSHLPLKKIEESSSSDSDSQDEGDGLFSIAKENKSPPKIRKVEKRKVQMFGDPVRSRITLQTKEREFRRAASERHIRARLEPDVTPLLRRILSWKPDHSGSFPPDMKKDDFKYVAATFASPNKYEETFEPLLMLECWQHIEQAKMESLGEYFDFVIENRQKIDEYVELFVTMKPTVYAKIALLDPDLIIISNRQGKGGKECFAKVQGMKKKKDSVELGLRCLPYNDIAPILVPKATLFGLKLFSLTPILREYGALKGLSYYDLVEEILAARPSIPFQTTKFELEFTMHTYSVNEPQAAAIVGACRSPGFSLIQGPPGTGKTKTILGMVGAFLTGSVKPGATLIDLPGEQPSAHSQKPKLLLCAPSNAAVDEIVVRLIGGIRDSQGQRYHPKVVRVGRSDNINARVRSVTLDELVDKKLEAIAPPSSEKAAQEGQYLRAELNKVIELRNAKGLEYDRARELGNGDMAALANQLRELNAQKNRIGAQLDDQKEKRTALIRDAEVNRRQIISVILDEADVICCTLSGSGHDQLVKMKVDFETVIIDEAAQSIELAALIPLKYGCQRCVLVGDPNQLPPTVLSQAAAKFQYEESLFVRMQRNYPNSVYLLSIQYRMSPEISFFPSTKFYDSKLIDGPNMATVTKREWHQSSLFRPYCFFNVKGAQESGKRGVSLMNKTEAMVATSIYDRLCRDFDHIDFTGKIGIVTPYKEQLRELIRQFRRIYGQDITDSIDFNTIDGFQGQEKDIIILSCVRSAENQGVGFLKDVRRINVALTRAKSTLMILGDKQALSSNEFWRDLTVDAEKRGMFVNCGPETFSQGFNLPIKAPTKASPIQQKAVAKRKGAEPMGELIPLGLIAPVGKKTSVVVDSDVEMRNAGSSSEELESSESDSDSEPSPSEGKDIEMTDAAPDTPPPLVPKAQNALNKRKRGSVDEQSKRSRSKRPLIGEQELKKPLKVDKSSSKKLSSKKPPESDEGSKRHTSPQQTPSHSSDKLIAKPVTHPVATDTGNLSVIKRKAGAASLFINSKKPPRPEVGVETGRVEKKESVKQRLAREMVLSRSTRD